MNIIVQKYGGTSVANLERIRAVAERVKRYVGEGKSMVVVLSAMSGDTDGLIKLAKELSPSPDARSMDLLLATGEQITVALLAMLLNEMRVPAEAFTGLQAGIATDANFGRARIRSIDPRPVVRALSEGKVAVVAGFQGATEKGEITTIGRGGSDTTAVALAAALAAEKCEIYTDVEGIFTADPRRIPDAKLLEKASYEEMMEIADSGAKVLHTRSVEVAAKYGVPLVVRSSFSDAPGTTIVSEDRVLESSVVSGITCSTGEAKVSIRKVPDKVGVTAAIFAPIAAAGIDVDVIVQTVSEEGFTELSFTVPKDDLRRALSLSEVAAKKVQAGKVSAAGDVAKVSAVGLGMRGHAGVAHRMFAALAKKGISIQMIGTSEIKVSIVIDMRHADAAVAALHEEFGL